MKKFQNNNNLIFRALNEFKYGWNLSNLPDHIENFNNNIYVKLFKLIGGACLALNLSGIAHQFNILIFYLIFSISFLYTIYRLIIVFYYFKQFIINVYKGKFISRNSPVNTLNTLIRVVGGTIRNTANFGIGTGVAYCLCYELDEILVTEGKEPYFVPGMRSIIRQIGAEEQARNFLTKVGIKNNTNNSKSITALLESMTEAERVKYESETGQKWENLYNEQKKLQEIMKQSSSNKTSSITKTISDCIEKENPFKKNK